MRTTDRIPVFAICARCGARRQLAGCGRCGILVCRDCRDERACAVCHAESRAAADVERRRERRRELGRRAVVVALVAMSGVTGLGAAFVPGPSCSVIAAAPPKGEALPPPVLARSTLTAASQRPLVFHCLAARSDLLCCTIVESP